MKLIRHKIPALAAARGDTLRTRMVADMTELRALLAAKLLEEAGEFAAEPSIDELADVFEVVQCLLSAHGWSREMLEGRWAWKRRERGGLLRGTLAVGLAFLGDPMKPGERILIMHGNMDRSGPSRTMRAVVISEGTRHRATTDSFPWLTEDEPRIEGSCLYESEGITWARGWSDETAGALAAAWALAEVR